jgi:hypothetical protein
MDKLYLMGSAFLLFLGGCCSETSVFKQLYYKKTQVYLFKDSGVYLHVVLASPRRDSRTIASGKEKRNEDWKKDYSGRRGFEYYWH